MFNPAEAKVQLLKEIRTQVDNGEIPTVERPLAEIYAEMAAHVRRGSKQLTETILTDPRLLHGSAPGIVEMHLSTNDKTLAALDRRDPEVGSAMLEATIDNVGFQLAECYRPPTLPDLMKNPVTFPFAAARKQVSRARSLRPAIAQTYRDLDTISRGS